MIQLLDEDTKSSLFAELNGGKNRFEAGSCSSTEWTKLLRRLGTLKDERNKLFFREVGAGRIPSLSVCVSRSSQPSKCSSTSALSPPPTAPSSPSHPPSPPFPFSLSVSPVPLANCDNAEVPMFSLREGTKYCRDTRQPNGNLFSCVVSTPKYLLFAVLEEGCNICEFSNPRDRLKVDFACVAFALLNGVMLRACSRCHPVYSRVVYPSSDMMWMPNQLMALSYAQISGIMGELSQCFSQTCRHIDVLLEVALPFLPPSPLLPPSPRSSLLCVRRSMMRQISK